MFRLIFIVSVVAFLVPNAYAQEKKVQQAAAPETSVAAKTSTLNDLRTRCVALFGARTYSGHIKNNFPKYVHGVNASYTFSTDGTLATAPNGKQVCEVVAKFSADNGDTDTFKVRFDGSILGMRGVADPDRWIMFTPKAGDTLVRTGRERVIYGSVYGAPVPGTNNIYDTGTIEFRLRQ